MPAPAPLLRVPLHYDFASTLCCVAHRSLPTLADELERLRIEFIWTPLDLASLLGWRRGAAVHAERRQHALDIAAEMGVALRAPTHWIDSRRALAVGLTLGPGPREITWRERVFTAVYDEGRSIESEADLAPLTRELGLELDPHAVEAGLQSLASHTAAARAAEITGVPTFMIGSWPLGGVQTDETMRLVLRRWADKQRKAPV